MILLNGPPGSGKSTLARRYVSDHRLALNLDIDRVRSMLGGWQDAAGDAGLAARAIALAAAQTHLGAGHDVVIPQLIAREGFLGQLDALVEQAGVPFAEIVLLDSPENLRRRFRARTGRAQGSLAAEQLAHAEAAAMLERDGGLVQLDRYHQALVELIGQRPHATVVHTRDGDVEEAYADVLAVVEQVRTPVSDPQLNPEPGAGLSGTRSAERR